MKAWGVLAAAIVAALVPASAGAKPGYFVSPPEQRAQFSVQGSNGYSIAVEAAAASHGQRHQQVYVIARRGAAIVYYSVRDSLGPDHSIDVHLPHVGRIAVQFNPTTEGHGLRPDNCRGRKPIVETGYFRGAIRLRGEQGFTEVDQNSAPGQVTRSFREVCDNGDDSFGKHPERKVRFTNLIAGKDEGSGALDFSASQGQFGSMLGRPTFSASSFRRREGMNVISTVSAEGSPGQLVISKPGSPKVVEVTPPEPFLGTASFHLTSRTTSTWEGDLSVELPGVGMVSLADSDFWSALCTDLRCTETAPPGVYLAFATSFEFGSIG